MSKIKMRCTTCGKWFQSANAKEVTCPECVQKARKEKQTAKATPPVAPKPTGQGTSAVGHPNRPPTAPKPKPAASSSSWLDSVSDVKVSEPESPPPQRPRPSHSPAPRENYGGGAGSRGPGGYRGSGTYRDERPASSGGYRGPGAYHNAPLTGSIVGGISQRPRQPIEGGIPGRGPRPGGPGEKYNADGKRGGRPSMGQKKPRSAPAPKREKIPPPEPFKPTPEQITQVEARYLELAIPTEFDGIRTQIAHELTIPKKAVKQIIKELREREHIPSWWETQTYKGDDEEKARIKAAYEPYLPLPNVGVHRKIADELDLKPGTVYQAIKTIRLEMNLPPYNDPDLHAEEFAEIRRKAQEAREAREAAKAAQAAAAQQNQESAVSTETEQATAASEANAEDQGVSVVAATSAEEKSAE